MADMHNSAERFGRLSDGCRRPSHRLGSLLLLSSSLVSPLLSYSSFLYLCLLPLLSSFYTDHTSVSRRSPLSSSHSFQTSNQSVTFSTRSTLLITFCYRCSRVYFLILIHIRIVRIITFDLHFHIPLSSSQSSLLRHIFHLDLVVLPSSSSLLLLLATHLPTISEQTLLRTLKYDRFFFHTT